ncbi:MAG: DUF1571 domain-containing protein [Planctomycetota bacterium]|nr:DUF1571 domain-containing protein [Planctomycetota bacterium]MDA1213112.1 DUF1571 domain-containing protein [Planctomycetota bacterium]
MSVRVIAFVCFGLAWVNYSIHANDSIEVPAERSPSGNRSPKQTANAKPSIDGIKSNGLNSRKPIDPAHPMHQALAHAYTVKKTLQEIQDYEASFSKRVNIKGKLIAETMHLKVREKPFSVYLKYRKPHQGREVLYINGQNGNKLLAHETGFKGLAGTIQLDPNSQMAMEGNAYPITEIGLSKLIHQVTDDWESLLNDGDCQVKFYREAKLGETPCLALEVKSHTAVEGIRYHLWRLYCDKRANIPLHIELYGFPRRQGEQPPLLEEYTYSQVRLNVGLTDHDFSTKNAAYRF